MTVTPGNAIVQLGSLNQTFDGKPKPISVTTTPAGLGVSIANLAEYALGTNPRQFTAPLVATKDANGLTLTFTRPAGLPGITYAAESSDVLGPWTPVGLEVVEPGAIETIRTRDPLTGDPSRRFIRLRFEKQ